MRKTRIARRAVIAAAAASPFVIGSSRAQAEPIRLGALPPLTGAGGPYGPSMLKAIQAVVDEVNAAGGVKGRKIQLSYEDDQTTPDAGVRGARKLIDVDRVSAIMGTWASAVTTAVAPLCWENKVMLFTVSGSDTITRLPHQGYIIRTQPDTRLQTTRQAEYLLSQKVKRVFFLSAQSPFAQPTYEYFTEFLRKGGAEAVGQVIYERDKTAFRSEVDQALKAKPDTLFLNGYVTDVTILLREIYRAGFDGRKATQAYAMPQKSLDGLPPDVTEGLLTFAPSPDPGSTAYQRVKTLLGTEPDPYSCQTYDHASLAILAAAAAGDASGPAIKDAVRKISQGSGQKVTDAVSGLKLLAEGKQVNYDGASGPCDFTEIGDILDCKIRVEVAEKGRYRLLAIS